MKHWEVVDLLEALGKIEAREKLAIMQATSLGSGFGDSDQTQGMVEYLIEAAGFKEKLPHVITTSSNESWFADLKDVLGVNNKDGT